MATEQEQWTSLIMGMKVLRSPDIPRGTVKVTW